MKKEKLTNSYMDEIKSYMKGIKSPSEVLSSSMTTTRSNFCFLWRPNNYRRQMGVKTKTDDLISYILGAIDVTGRELNFNEHTKLISVKNYMGVTIQYGKDKLTGIYSQNVIAGSKETFLLESDSIDKINGRIDERKEGIRRKIDIALFNFATEFKILLRNTKPIWSRHEDWIKGEDYIDKIPRETIIHDTLFKKVYGEGIEFKNSKVGQDPGTNMKNYIKNRALEDISPEIVSELKDVKGYLKFRNSDISESIKETHRQLQLFIEAQVNTQDQLSSLILALKPLSRPKEKPLGKPDYFG